jgi:hypothetical protein
MNYVVCTCGHKVNDLKLAHHIEAKDYDRNGNECASSLVVCGKCLSWYKKEKLFIKEYK